MGECSSGWIIEAQPNCTLRQNGYMISWLNYPKIKVSPVRQASFLEAIQSGSMLKMINFRLSLWTKIPIIMSFTTNSTHNSVHPFFVICLEIFQIKHVISDKNILVIRIFSHLFAEKIETPAISTNQTTPMTLFGSNNLAFILSYHQFTDYGIPQ